MTSSKTSSTTVGNVHLEDTWDNQGDPETNLDFYVKEIRKRLESEGVTVPNHCNEFVIRCLRVKSYATDKAAMLLKNFEKMMKMEAMQEIFKHFKPTAFKDLYFSSGIIAPLQQRDPQGRLLLYGRAGNWDVETYDFDQIFAAVIVLFNFCNAMSPEIQRNGIVFLLDGGGVSFQHIRNIKLGRLKVIVKLLEGSTPGKIKGIHFIRLPKLAKVLFTLIRPFIKNKLVNRIHFHENDLSSFDRYCGEVGLPKTLGDSNANDDYIDASILNDLMKTDQYCQDMVKYAFPAY